MKNKSIWLFASVILLFAALAVFNPLNANSTRASGFAKLFLPLVMNGGDSSSIPTPINPTATPVPPTATAAPPTPTSTQSPPTPTSTSVPPSPTPTNPSPTQTSTSIPPSPTPTSTLADPPPTPVPNGDDWPMVAANPERTSWSPEEVTGNLQVQWYRPIEAYIPQNVQVIASNGLLYIATARGLYALDAANGNLVWRYDTELPLGNSPTVQDGVVYVGGYDRELHALDALTGTPLWSFSGAKAGYDTNPLVVDGKVIAGNRDGTMYAIGAHGTPQQGQLIWSFQTGGAIHLSAAYKNGAVYFAADDNYAYALNVSNGRLVWKSQKLLGDGYHSYWPVIYQDKVIFSAAISYRFNLNPGTRSVDDGNGGSYPSVHYMQIADIFAGAPEGSLIGPQVSSPGWAHGFTVLDASSVTEYLENNPHPDVNKHKPWRRVFFVLNTSDGSEYTFDSDQDGYPEYLPAGWWGTKNGNRYPAIVGQDNNLYFGNIYRCCSDAKGEVMGWNPANPSYLSVVGGFGALAEPQAISAGGSVIYRNLCCDRVGGWFSTTTPGMSGELWSYDLTQYAPGYDSMWTVLPGLPRLQAWYKGNSDSINGIYHNHGDQNPIVPYQGRLYVHRSNAILAFGPGSGPGQLPLLTASPAQNNSQPLSVNGLTSRLETEVQKIINAGHLRPGYYNNGQFNTFREFTDYFDNPGDTLYTLAIAYPHLSSSLQQQTRAYLQNEFQTYFDPNMFAVIGWEDGAPREAMPLPPEVETKLSNFPAKAFAGPRSSWFYPQYNFYGMWKYAEIFPEDVASIYNLAKSKLEVPVSAIATTSYFTEKPWELNAYIAGYTGFLNLQQLAGMDGVDSQLRMDVTNELNRLLQLRVSIFTKDTPYMSNGYHKRHLNVARNFIMLVPELGDYLNQNLLARVQEAIDEYDYVAPYWFVARFESTIDEGVMSVLYNYPAMFQAKAFILKESRDELTKYLDVPAFERGDLFYIQNLVAAIEAPATVNLSSVNFQKLSQRYCFVFTDGRGFGGWSRSLSGNCQR